MQRRSRRERATGRGAGINTSRPKGTEKAMRTLGRMAHLPDVYPQDGSGALRWPDGTLWVPLLWAAGCSVESLGATDTATSPRWRASSSHSTGPFATTVQS
jgi:hypothetical protein